jgi:ribosomal protein L11 methyltransferase
MIGSLLLRFPWHKESDVMEVSGGRVPKHELILQGGMAFGTGEHATTQLCCGWLEKTIVAMQLEGRIARVLDYGAGSGVLGLAALRFGAREAVGVEIDRDSILAAAANAGLNQLHMPCYLPSAAAQGSQAADDVIYAAQIRRIRQYPLCD